ncbi:hypothetical protein D3C77_312100 [compost metagenome]
MDLINHDVPQIMEQGRNCIRPIHEQPLQRFGRNLQDAGGALHELGLLRLGDITVPMPDRHLSFPQQLGNPLKLIVDQRLQRPDI